MAWKLLLVGQTKKCCQIQKKAGYVTGSLRNAQPYAYEISTVNTYQGYEYRLQAYDGQLMISYLYCGVKVISTL